MVEQKSNNQKPNNVLKDVLTPSTIFLFVIAVLFAVLSTSQGVRNGLEKIFYPEQKVLSKISFQIADKAFVVYKFKRRNSIQIDIFEGTPDQGETLLQTFTFDGDENAMLQVKDVPVSLGVSEGSVSGDFELFAPTIDRFGGSRLNVFRYDAGLNQFLQISPESN